MRPSKLLAVAALAVAGCGPTQPELYQVTMSAAAVPLAGSCYTSGTAPSLNDQTTDRVEAQTWMLWGIDQNEQYLDAGDINVDMGDALNVSFSAGDAIRGEFNKDHKLVFKATRHIVSGERTYDLTAEYQFDDRGAVVRGLARFESTCVGTNCLPSCSRSVEFNGVRVDASRQQFYFAGNP